MNTKLTLTIEQSVIEKAKKYAKEKERSLSDLIENYLKALTNDSDHDEFGKKDIELTPIVKSLKGSFSAPKNSDYKKDLADRLSDKYL
jgi:hypothetical protein